MIWLIASLLAAFFQTIRTATQKHLKDSLPTDAINWVRYSFGFPFVAFYVFALWALGGFEVPEPRFDKIV